MIKTFEANPNTSCGLRPRLRRDLDHAERQEESAVFTLLLAFSMLQLAVCSLDGAVWSVHLALWALELIIKKFQAPVRGSQEAAWTLQRLSGGDNWLPGPSKSFENRCRNAQRTLRRAFRASGRCWRGLNNEKPQKQHCFHHFRP